MCFIAYGGWFTTVFCVLALVIIIAKVLILAVNKYAPEQDQNKKVAEVNPAISPAKMSAIVAAVSMITHGKGHVEKVEKNK
jgi:oxaloacetate decarboxylase gamma subunit